MSGPFDNYTVGLARECGRAEAFSDLLADALRRILNTPIADGNHRDAVINAQVVLQTYDEDRADVVTAKTVESASRPS